MGAYGSPDTYPYEALNNKPGGKPPRPPRKESGRKPIWKRWWFWVNALWAVLGIAVGGVKLSNTATVAVGCCLFAIVYNAIRFLIHLWTNRSLKGPAVCVAAALGIMMACGLTLNAIGYSPTSAVANQTQLTKSLYDQIQQGMGYDEVCDLLGSKGVLYHESGFEESNSEVKAYYWGTEKQNLYVGFLNGVVYDKGQTGLK